MLASPEVAREGDESEVAGINLPTSVPEQVAALVVQAFAGTLPRSRPLTYWEPEKLRPRHIQAIRLQIAGYNNNDIAEALGYTPSRVSILLSHPDAQTIRNALVSVVTGDALDVRTQINQASGEALNVVLDSMRNVGEYKEKAKIAFGILDRAGYSVVQKVENKTEINLTAKVGDRLSDALLAFTEVSRVDYSKYLELGEGSSAGSSASTDSAPVSESVPPTQSQQDNPPPPAYVTEVL